MGRFLKFVAAAVIVTAFPLQADAQTRDIVHNIYLRKVEKKDGQLWNVEFDVIKDVKDPGKTK